jgi:hypothetical protein
MVTLGFIGEGSNEKTVLESPSFRALLDRMGFDYLPYALDAKGGGNLLPKYLEDQIARMYEEGATRIIILADQEDNPCITSVKNRIDPENQQVVVVAVKAIESWFLADTKAISTYFGRSFVCEHPESIQKPFIFIKEQKLKLTGRGVDRKKQLCSRILASGFSLEAAAAHPNCPSAKYFLDKLCSLTIQQS